MFFRFVALIAVVASACTTAEPAPTSPPDPFEPPQLAPVGTPMDAVVMRVIDGDSMEVSIDGEADEVRLLGINAPEGDECLGEAAAEAMKTLVEGDGVVLFGTERDQFGRLLAFMEVDGTPVGWLALRRGFALAISTDHPRLAAFAEAEDDAFIDEVGIWALDACGPPSGAIVGIEEIVWDPPGRDSDDLNGEFITLSAHSGSIDLTDWVLRDESTRWRYRFPDGFTLNDEVIVHTGCGEDEPDELYWCATDPLWSNFGDTAMVLDPVGNVVARVTYGAKTDR